MIHLNNMNPSATFFTASLGAMVGKNISPTFRLLDDPDFFSLLKNAHPKPDTFLVRPLFGKIPNRLPLALQIEQRLEDKDEYVRRQALEDLGRIIPHLKLEGRLPRVLKTENLLKDKKWHVREAAIQVLGEIIPHLEPADRLPRVLKIEQRLKDKDLGNREVPIQVLGKVLLHLEPADRLPRALKIEKRLKDEIRRVREAAIQVLGEIIPHLEPADRLRLILQIEKRLEDENWRVREAAIQVFGAIIPHLEPADRLPHALKMEQLLSDEYEFVRKTAIEAFGKIIHYLEPGGRLWWVGEIEKRLEDKSLDVRQTAVNLLVHLDGVGLSPGAIWLLILLGKELVKGGVGDLTEVNRWEEGDRFRLRSTAKRFRSWIQHWKGVEALLKGYPTVGGKIRGIEEMTECCYEFGRAPLIEGEPDPVLLYPVRDPSLLAQTVSELVYLSGEIGPLPFRLSITLSGKVGDDLKPAALGVHSLLKIPFPFPDEIRSTVGFNWFAPVVEGGGFFESLNAERDEKEKAGRMKRYDHLFLSFLRPPILEWFQEASMEDPWVEARAQFVTQLRPKIKGIDSREKYLRVALSGNQKFVWFPPASVWQAMTRKGEDGKTKVDRATFQTLFFLEFARRAMEKELSEIIETAWVLGMLREVLRNGEGEMDTGLLQRLNQPDLKDLANHYEKALTRSLEKEGLGSILKTPWVDNKDWSVIRDDMRRFQRALEENPGFEAVVQILVRTTVARAKDILFPPSE